ncbi:phosphatidylglycerophosphatase A [Sulfuriferula plumbiphila]|uniref:Phosphatidylglycerophosphatase A n=2 Tax=Sulfuriferula plumbiphila TaxID=171865 RepID=A0A512LAN1_9PROT|nr:phosphatidylglycerophosphatase A [Sulfuriferula plumbiphila]GEP31544.1 phosphatidylglycerophosphatase A [Sulfuriferula plumbiphila]
MHKDKFWICATPAMTTFPPDWRFITRHPAYFLAFGLGSGLAPRAPGTFGTLAALPLYYLLAWFATPTQLYLIIGIAVVAGIWICGKTGRDLGVADHGGIVWDEIAAFWIVLAATPQTPLWVAAAFGLFRLFDIWKPFPIRQFDARLKNGFGVMLDDLLAAGYTLLALFLAQKILP